MATKGWQIFIWDEDAQDFIGTETFRDPMLLAMACYNIGMTRTEIEVREVKDGQERHFQECA